jgi:hypothetical protein
VAIRALPLVLLSLAGALSSRDEGAAVRTNRLEFEFAGCARVRPGPVCELGEQRELTLWVPGSEKPQIGGAESVREARFVETGWQMKLALPAASRELRLRAGERRGRLRVAESSEPQPLRELARLWTDGKWEQVRASLDAAGALLKGADRERVRAYRARLSMRDGDNARAASELERTAESARNAGLWLEASHDRFAAAHIRTNRLGEYERARADLDATSAEFALVPEVRARLAYHRGVLARTTGDVQAALIHFRDASVLARRIDLIADELTARQELSLALNRLHRHAEALVEQEAIVARDVKIPSCVEALRWECLAWVALSQPDPKFQGRAAEALDRAERLHAQCPDPVSRRNLELNRVELALLRGDTEDAASRLRALEADTTGRNTRLAAWQALYSGKLAVLRGDGSKALAAFEHSVALAESVQLLDCVYAAKLGRARILSLNQDPAVVDAYLQAEGAVDALLRWTPFGQGQQLTALRTQESSQELLSVLLQRNDVTQAYALAARAARRTWAASFRSNRIAALSGARKARWDRAIAEYQRQRQALERAARDDWKMSAEGLSQIRLSRALEVQRLENALAEGYALLADESDRELPPRATQSAELTLARGKDDWFAFLRHGNVLKVERLRDVGRDLVIALERFEHQNLLDAPMLRVIAPPELSTLDVQALELDGRALIERLPVAYGFEPGRLSEPPAPQDHLWTALVLGDPNEDLPWAGAEARRLSNRLPHSLSRFGAEVGFESVRSHLPDVGLLHFAGHANSGGLDGLDGALQLSAGQRLTFGDIFSLRRVPEFVVLSACTSSVSPGSGGGLSIGQAFVAAGSRVVIGASRAVSDRLAQNFMQALYDALLSESGAELPRDDGAWARAVRVASMKVKRDDPTADWASLRLLVP